MFNFDEQKILSDHEGGVKLIPETQEIVDKLVDRGYSSIIYLGIGGTVLYAGQMMHIVKEMGSKLPFYLENAADYCLRGNPFVDKDSIVVIETISGDTKELVEALEKVREVGATTIGYVEKTDSPVYKLLDHAVCGINAAYYFWYTVTLRLMNRAGDFDGYDRMMGEMKHLPANIVQIYKDADAGAKAYADKYCDAELTYLIGSGNLQDWAVCYGMCIMEEMQWMKTRPISAADFFHGTLEVVERDTVLLLIKGEDKTRPEMDRVEKFADTICANITVFDTKDYKLNGISDEFRWILAPIVMRSAFQRINVHLEHNRRHPLAIRRYYRRLDY